MALSQSYNNMKSIISKFFSDKSKNASLKDSNHDIFPLEFDNPERVFSYQNLTVSVQNYENFTVEDKFSVIQKSIIQELFYSAEYMLGTLHTQHHQNPQYASQIYALQQELKMRKAHKKSLKITVFGDSLALPRRGYVKHGDALHNPILLNCVEDTYPLILEDKLAKIYPQKKVRVFNCGMRAATIKNAVAREHDIFYNFNPDIFILHIGIVDCWIRDEQGTQYVTLHEYEKRLKILLNQRNINRPDLKVILLGILKVPEHHLKKRKIPQLNEIIKNYNKVMKKCASAMKDVIFIDPNQYAENAEHDIIHLDGHHLTAYGAHMIANLLRQAVNKFINNDTHTGDYPINNNY